MSRKSQISFIRAIKNYLNQNGLENVFLIRLVNLDEFVKLKNDNGIEVDDYFITIVSNGGLISKNMIRVEFYIVAKDPEIVDFFSNKLCELLSQDEYFPKYKWKFQINDGEKVFDIHCARDYDNGPKLWDIEDDYIYYYEVEFELDN